MANVMTPWQDMSNTARGSLAAGVVLILLLTVGGFFWLASEDYQVLFTDMEPRDAANVVAELDRLKIDYKLGQGGSQILVPETAVHEIRLKLMGSGVPLVGGVGFEIFDNSDFGMTEFAQRINYQRALEGELTRTITTLKEVKYARVHLVMPEKGLFQQQDEPPSASVTLFLKQEFLDASRKPSQAQILGIQRLVSAAVPGLKAGMVTVTDQAGMTLSQPMTEQKSMAMVSERLQQKQAVEAYLTEKANDVLTRTFGASQAMVSVDVELDFNEVKRTRENVVTPEDGQEGIVRRRETRLGNGADTKAAEGNVTTEVEYRLGRTVEQTVETPGKILRLSVGVVVPAETSLDRRNEIRELVEMSVGLNISRGDAIAVYTMDQPQTPFSMGHTEQPAAELPMPSASLQSQQTGSTTAYMDWLKNKPEVLIAVAAVVVLLILVLFGFAVRRRPTEHESKVLSQEEREAALAKITQWLEQSQPEEQRETA